MGDKIMPKLNPYTTDEHLFCRTIGNTVYHSNSLIGYFLKHPEKLPSVNMKRYFHSDEKKVKESERNERNS